MLAPIPSSRAMTVLTSPPRQAVVSNKTLGRSGRCRCLTRKDRFLRFILPLLLLALTAAPSLARADDGPSYGPELQGFDYPWPVAAVPLRLAGRGAGHGLHGRRRPKTPNGRTAVLLHGKNFCAATWQATIGVLAAAGYRVIAPDQIGFCKSSKPEHYQFSFQQLAGEHPCAAAIARRQAGDRHRPFDRRHARDPLRADVSGRG